MPRRAVPLRPRGQRDLSLPVWEQAWEVGTPEHGQRLDTFLAARISWRSRTGVQGLIQEGCVEIRPHKDPQQAPVGGLREGLKLRVGQEVVVRVPAPRDPPLEAYAAGTGEPLSILFEDDWLLGVDKPPGVSVHPSKGHLTGSLIHRIHEAWRAAGARGEVPHLCHRLDRDTSGVVLAAKDLLARSRLGRQFERRRVEKTYLAVVAGVVPGEEGKIDLPLGHALTSPVRLKMAVRHDAAAQPACTMWRVVRRLAGRTLLELRPRTGRQHQLRVHLAAIGHPILGDKLYLGGEEVFLRALNGALTAEDRRLLVHPRQALHAFRLVFEHPYTGRRTTLEAPLAPDLQALVD